MPDQRGKDMEIMHYNAQVSHSPAVLFYTTTCMGIGCAR